MGVLAISLGVAVFPLLSRYAARNDMPNLRDAVNRAIRLL
jgi:peptidoglycan biosynthesis protein MviN/MurJ (putative lipid II flippase)